MYRGLKSDLLAYLGVQDWMMHLTLGMAFYAVVFAALRRPWLTLWLLIALQVGNEFMDISEQFGSAIDFRQSITDTLWTLAFPTACAACLATIMEVASAIRR